MRYKAVIYDCDGVMFDSFEANLAFYQRIMGMMGREPLDRSDEEQMRILHTYANREVLAHFFHNPREWEEAVRCAGRIDYRDLVPLMVMEQGFRETLDQLKGRVELAVCTNRSTSMDTVLESFDLAPYFGLVMTASKVDNPKPHPEPLLKVVEHFGIEPGEALFVGDSAVDCMAAEAAGVPFVAYKADLPAMACIDCHGDVIALVRS
ncbi:HAD family hydrolase [Geobacter hydrogenophilus]|uniref:phosphoglycolate phosphatase n=1 Tax=Geobacter hydrogenophilus TaxID=40983 RepID=A0A9W6FYE9_9BACT|nr:HAD family hydrolase [Geobacter hydrogenophilus]MBT0894932.1 HAD family hydrolase [Geobacter hydrogenophilus]GLI37097.1 haloacid dehalogenase [Geobacter hydrogenophilus]